MIVLNQTERELAQILLDHILNNRGKLTYKEAAQKLSSRLGTTINPHFDLSTPLGHISTCCFELGLPLISAYVTYANPKTVDDAAGKGFYSLACDLKPQYRAMSPGIAWKQELNAIQNCTDWSLLVAQLTPVLNIPPEKQSDHPSDNNSFSAWLSVNTNLADSSIYKYSSAVRVISNEMLDRRIIAKPIQNMSVFELDIALSNILGNPEFISKNLRGNHMYSNALKQYRYFINATVEETEPVAYLEQIKNDPQIAKTEREALVQSRVGQGVFRKSLMDKYHGSCIITKIDHPKLLVASHIKPWAASTNSERLSVDNGLLLSATYDRLFDAGLITFDRSGKIYLSSFIGKQNEAKLHLTADMQFDLFPTPQMVIFLEYHHDMLFIR